MDLALYKGCFFDLDGCLRYGLRAAHGASTLLRTLRQQGKSILVLTNTSTKGAEELAQELRGTGLDVVPTEIQTAFDVAGEYLHDRFGATKVLCLGTSALQERLCRDGHEVLAMDRCREATAVVIGKDPDFNIDRMVAASQAIDAGAAFIALNTDVRMPIEDGTYTAGAGPLVAAIRTLTYKEPEILGKPSRAFFDRGLRRMGLAPHETIMVGDNIETDIKGGRAAGLLSILITASHIAPNTDLSQADLVVRDLCELLPHFGVRA
jgi:HAD superfamily hydrolase (TIGR01450 family)